MEADLVDSTEVAFLKEGMSNNVKRLIEEEKSSPDLEEVDMEGGYAEACTTRDDIAKALSLSDHSQGGSH